MVKSKALVRVSTIKQRILFIRGEKVIIDADLAEFYGVNTKALNKLFGGIRIVFLKISCSSLLKVKKWRWSQIVTTSES